MWPSLELRSRAYNTLQRVFGFSSFRLGQEDTISSIISGSHTLLVAPTGLGKSLTYFLPSLLLPGVTFIISPLVALIQDQSKKLDAFKIPHGIIAPSLNAERTTLTYNTLLNMSSSNIKVVLITPESITGKRGIALLNHLNSFHRLSFFALDESHLVNDWADFRKSYAQLKILVSNFPHIPFLCTTATASKSQQFQILDSLGISRNLVKVLTLNSDRPEIFYSVIFKELLDDPLLHLEITIESLCSISHGRGIVFVHKRTTAESLAAFLSSKISNKYIGHYHGGLSANERLEVQQQFLSQQGVLVATVSFGLGIDVDVNFVIHYDAAQTLSQLIQESGRCARDKSRGNHVVYYDRSTIMKYREIFVQNIKPGDEENLRLMLEELENVHNYCTSPSCKRKFMLNFFNCKPLQETYQHGCCIYCKDKNNYLQQLEQLETTQISNNNEKIPKVDEVPPIRKESSSGFVSASSLSKIKKRSYHEVKLEIESRKRTSQGYSTNKLKK
ncbi:hypothetical protein RCL1_003169 [Eukaryota sp. TZLM3-RCL]